VHVDVAGQLLVRYSAFIKYLRMCGCTAARVEVIYGLAGTVVSWYGHETGCFS
jgi:hypothetical protein